MPKVGGDLLRQLREAANYGKLEKIRNSLPDFIHYIMRDEKGKPLQLGKHHLEWYAALWDQVKDIVEPDKHHIRPKDSKDNLLILGPREHGKTTSMVGFLLYCLGKNCLLRVKYVSRSDELSIQVLGQVSDNIVHNERLHEVFPNLKPDPDKPWTGSKLYVLKVDEAGKPHPGRFGIKDASLQAYGIGAPATGGRADILCFDDIIGSREAIQEPARLPKIAQMFYSDWGNIGGRRQIVIGTPWTVDDIHAQLTANPDWMVWKKPAIINGKPLWPERWPVEKLMERKRGIGDMAFALQFMLEGLTQKQEWWNDEIINHCKDRGTKFGKVPADFVIDGISVGLDPASSMKHDGSHSCCFVILYDKMHRKLVYRIIRGRFQPRDLVKKVVDLILEIEATLTRKVDVITVETNSTQKTFVDLIALECEKRSLETGSLLVLRLPITCAFTGAQKWNYEVGLPRIVSDFDNRKWIIPWGDEHHKGKKLDEWEPFDPLHECALCDWINEMKKFDGSDSCSTDTIMASWLASSAIDKEVLGDVPAFVRRTSVNVTNVNWG